MGGGSTDCPDHFGFGSSFMVGQSAHPVTGVIHKAPFRINLLFGHFHDLRNLLRNNRLRWAALGDACFWSVGGFFYLVLVRLSGEVTEGNVGAGQSLWLPVSLVGCRDYGRGFVCCLPE